MPSTATATSIQRVTSTQGSWCNSPTKRLFDLVLSCALLVVIVPLLVCLALLVKITSSGPILFRQERVGRNGRTFTLLKFRTMDAALAEDGPGVTRQGDPRVTAIGKLLRQWKLDELPQLVNVLRGEMSMVGPRPELPRLLAAIPQELRDVTDLRPGLTGYSSLRYRNEEALLAGIPAEQTEDFYRRVLLRRKARLDLAYGRRSSFASDLALLLRTFIVILR